MIGATKNGEYARTIDMLVNMTNKTEKEIMMMLYFLSDSQYDNHDLKAMADIIREKNNKE